MKRFPKNTEKNADIATNRRTMLAAKATQLAQELPEGAAIKVAAGVAVEEKHLAVPPFLDLSREDSKIVTEL